jgi:hypothetical protein
MIQSKFTIWQALESAWIVLHEIIFYVLKVWQFKIMVRRHKILKCCTWQFSISISLNALLLKAIFHKLCEDMLQSRLKPKPNLLNPFKTF